MVGSDEASEGGGHVGDADQRRGRARRRTWLRRLLDGPGRSLEVESSQAPPGVDKPTPTPSRYRLGERIGTGGMDEVFRGTMIGAERFERTVAIKRILPALAQQGA